MMRKTLRILAFIMALNVLFSATGFAIFEHSCHALGLTSRSLSDDEVCGMELEATDTIDNGELSFKQNSCCETHAHFNKVDHQTNTSIQHIDMPFLAVVLQKSDYLFGLDLSSSVMEDSMLPPVNAPPSSGRDILLKNQTFLI